MQGRTKYQRYIPIAMLFCTLLVNHVNKEDSILIMQKQAFDLIQFGTTDFGRLRFSDPIVKNKNCGILSPDHRKSRKSMLQMYHVLLVEIFRSSFSFIVLQCCSDVLRFRQAFGSNTPSFIMLKNSKTYFKNDKMLDA